MGYRLSKIYTRTGDSGETGLADGSRIPKDSPHIEAIGCVDELNSCLGIVLSHPVPQEVRDALQGVQNDLFDLGSDLSVPGRDQLTDNQVRRLEQQVDSLNAELPFLKEFILPGGGVAASACHLARAVCRRAERRLITLARSQALNPHNIAYLNRLSDLLFVAARVLARFESGSETFWKPGHNASSTGAEKKS